MSKSSKHPVVSSVPRDQWPLDISAVLADDKPNVQVEIRDDKLWVNVDGRCAYFGGMSRVAVACETVEGQYLTARTVLALLYNPGEWFVCDVCPACGHLVLPSSGCYCGRRPCAKCEGKSGKT